MNLPPLIGLELVRRVVATGADEGSVQPDRSLPDLPGLPPLPRELWEQILAAASAENPCIEIEKLCLLAGPWAQLCRDGTVYDLANNALGYYGRQQTWERVLALYRTLGVDPPGNGTVQAYFELACRHKPWRQGIQNVPHWHPFYEGCLLDYVKEERGHVPLKQIPTFLSNYAEIARLIVNADSNQIVDVKPSNPYYTELMIIAVQRDGEYALRNMRKRHPGNVKIMKAVMRANPWNAVDFLDEKLNLFTDEEQAELSGVAERAGMRHHQALGHIEGDPDPPSEDDDDAPMLPHGQQPFDLSEDEDYDEDDQ